MLGLHQADDRSDLVGHPLQQLRPQQLVLTGVVVVQHVLDQLQVGRDHAGAPRIAGGDPADETGGEPQLTPEEGVDDEHLPRVGELLVLDGRAHGVLLWTGTDRVTPTVPGPPCRAAASRLQRERHYHPGMEPGLGPGMEPGIGVSVLGDLEVVRDGVPLPLGGRKPRTLLGVLVAARGRTVGTERLVDELWGDDPPPKVLTALQVYVAKLRRSLEPDRGPRDSPSVLVTRTSGYALVVPDDAVDARRFEDLVSAAGEARLTEARLTEARLTEALALWHGPPTPACTTRRPSPRRPSGSGSYGCASSSSSGAAVSRPAGTPRR